MPDDDFTARLKNALGIVSRPRSLEEIRALMANVEIGCPHCGRCVLAGGPCCDGMAADIAAHQASPKYQEMLKAEQEKGRREKAERKAAKRQRRLDRLAAKRT